MNKQELVEFLSEKELVASKAEGRRVLDAVLEAIEHGLQSNGSVTITNFGVFKVKERKSRKGRNPKTGESITIPPRKVVTFKTGKALKEKFND